MSASGVMGKVRRLRANGDVPSFLLTSLTSIVFEDIFNKVTREQRSSFRELLPIKLIAQRIILYMNASRNRIPLGEYQQKAQ